MRPTIQKVAICVFAPIVVASAAIGFVWCFIEFGWLNGNVLFNKLFAPEKPKEEKPKEEKPNV